MSKPYTFINQTLQSASSLRDSLVTDPKARMTTTAYGLGLLSFSAFVIINPLIVLYVAKFKLDEIEAKLTGTKMAVDARRNWSSNNIHARMFRLSMVFISLSFPKHWSKRGLVDLREINHLPRTLTRWVLIPGILNFFVVIGLCVFRLQGD
ncbi:MAG TPA: hypothetical protein VGC62_26140 [Pseudomonas sp.]|uniref:hypothetical protein n=1 Tax=Pseudomonas sp. TaxID=306 RepID=UPI002ED88456